MTPADTYLGGVLHKYAVDTGPLSPVRGVQLILQPLLNQWANKYLRWVTPSGSFAKGTANRGATDIDLFMSLIPETPETLQEIHGSLESTLKSAGYAPRLQNVSVNIKVGGFSVDLVPAKRQNQLSEDHSLYLRKRGGSWTKTNILTHITHVQASGRISEIRLLKLWRDQRRTYFPSIYLELAAITALRGHPPAALAKNVVSVLTYLRDIFPTARIVDPANMNNIISDDLTNSERATVSAAAARSLAASDWTQVVS